MSGCRGDAVTRFVNDLHALCYTRPVTMQDGMCIIRCSTTQSGPTETYVQVEEYHTVRWGGLIVHRTSNRVPQVDPYVYVTLRR